MSSHKKNLTTQLLEQLTGNSRITSIIRDFKIRKFRHIERPNSFMYSVYLIYDGPTEGDGLMRKMYICHTIEDPTDQWRPLVITATKNFDGLDIPFLKSKTLDNIKRYGLIVDRDFEDKLDRDICFEHLDINEKLYHSYISEIKSLLSEIIL